MTLRNQKDKTATTWFNKNHNDFGDNLYKLTYALERADEKTLHSYIPGKPEFVPFNAIEAKRWAKIANGRIKDRIARKALQTNH